MEAAATIASITSSLTPSANIARMSVTRIRVPAIVGTTAGTGAALLFLLPAAVVERIRSRSGAEKANQADDELPDKIDIDNNGELLQKYEIDPDELRDEFQGGSPSAT